MIYFAPHFGQNIAGKHAGIRVGISYVAQIKQIEMVEEWKDVAQVLKRHQDTTRHWKRLREREYQLHWDTHRVEQRSLLLLGEPRLVFNPPILKKHIQGGSGWLSKRFFSFDDLFEKWLQPPQK